jgi:hypothetical protein
MGGDGILVVMRRKVGMELRLLRHSPWVFTLVVSTCVVALLGRQSMKHRFRRPELMRPALAGLWWGAAASLICNDAGVLAASMVILYGCAWMFTELDPNPDSDNPHPPAPSPPTAASSLRFGAAGNPAGEGETLTSS